MTQDPRPSRESFAAARSFDIPSLDEYNEAVAVQIVTDALRMSAVEASLITAIDSIDARASEERSHLGFDGAGNNESRWRAAQSQARNYLSDASRGALQGSDLEMAVSDVYLAGEAIVRDSRGGGRGGRGND